MCLTATDMLAKRQFQNLVINSHNYIAVFNIMERIWTFDSDAQTILYSYIYPVLSLSE